MEGHKPHHGALWRRFAAAVVDAAIIALPTVAATGHALASGTAAAPAALVLACGLAMFYRVLFEGSRLAATPGKLLLGIRVAHRSGGRLLFATAALRAWPWWLTGAVAGVAPSATPVAAALSLLSIAAIPFSSSRQGLHDRMAGTWIVDRRETRGAAEADIEE